jgi:phospholipase A1
MTMKKLLTVLTLFCTPLFAAEDNPMTTCLSNLLNTAENTMTVGELKQQCQDTMASEEEHFSALKRRQLQEKTASWNAFSLLPHKPNYIIASYNTSDPSTTPFEAAYPDVNPDLQHLETKFQISMKLPIARNLIFGQGDLYAAYTNRSFWQQFNKTHSSPFRDTNHEAETWLSFDTDYTILGFRNSAILTGFTHQSNGQSGLLSRSWNRLYTDFILEKGDIYLSFKPWYRIPENESQDDNHDIDDFLGHFELRGVYKKQQHSFSLLFRNNLKTSSNKGAIELGWSFPIHNNVRGYVQWFNGYGESLLDYNNHTNSLGFGIQLNDWL